LKKNSSFGSSSHIVGCIVVIDDGVSVPTEGSMVGDRLGPSEDAMVGGEDGVSEPKSDGPELGEVVSVGSRFEAQNSGIPNGYSSSHSRRSSSNGQDTCS